jgi:dTDP-4-amino-4,6-dideoxygalactose transaminase
LQAAFGRQHEHFRKHGIDMSSGNTPFIPFATPDIGEAEIEEVVQCLRAGWVTTGPKTRQFEQDFSAYLGGGLTSIAVNSATAGLHLAVEAAGITSGDQVLVPTHTFTATAEVVRYVGADPLFVDIDLDTYCIDPKAASAAVTPKTRAILPVHYGGFPCEMDSLLQLARGRGLRVIEDAAHALPTYYKGKLIGSLDSDASVFSFYATKTITTGEGGMVVTRNEAIAKRARVMRLHGIDRDAFDRYTSNKPSWYYEVVAPGFKYNLTDIAAAIGIQQLRRSDQFQKRREQLARRYDAELANLPLVLPPRPASGSSHAWHLYVVRLGDDCNLSRDRVVEEMYARGIACSVHYIPLHLQPYWRDRYNLRPAQFPNSQKLFERGFSLPIYTRMSDSDQGRVIDALRAILGGTGR